MAPHGALALPALMLAALSLSDGCGKRNLSVALDHSHREKWDVKPITLFTLFA